MDERKPNEWDEQPYRAAILSMLDQKRPIDLPDEEVEACLDDNVTFEWLTAYDSAGTKLFIAADEQELIEWLYTRVAWRMGLRWAARNEGELVKRWQYHPLTVEVADPETCRRRQETVCIEENLCDYYTLYQPAKYAAEYQLALMLGTVRESLFRRAVDEATALLNAPFEAPHWAFRDGPFAFAEVTSAWQQTIDGVLQPQLVYMESFPDKSRRTSQFAKTSPYRRLNSRRLALCHSDWIADHLPKNLRPTIVEIAFDATEGCVHGLNYGIARPGGGDIVYFAARSEEELRQYLFLQVALGLAREMLPGTSAEAAARRAQYLTYMTQDLIPAASMRAWGHPPVALAADYQPPEHPQAESSPADPQQKADEIIAACMEHLPYDRAFILQMLPGGVPHDLADQCVTDTLTEDFFRGYLYSPAGKPAECELLLGGRDAQENRCVIYDRVAWEIALRVIRAANPAPTLKQVLAEHLRLLAPVLTPAQLTRQTADYTRAAEPPAGQPLARPFAMADEHARAALDKLEQEGVQCDNPAASYIDFDSVDVTPAQARYRKPYARPRWLFDDADEQTLRMVLYRAIRRECLDAKKKSES